MLSWKKKAKILGGVWEWTDLTATKDVEIFLGEIAKSKNAKMLPTGKYTKIRTLTYNERQGTLEVLKAFDAMEQGINKKPVAKN
ncbi:MAG: hypothetical protein WBV47_09130 [Salegentibacter sp.]